MAQILLTHEESEKYFHLALCNAVSSGYMAAHGIELTYDEQEYKTAKASLTNPCIEDVWMQILKDGGTLSFEDKEGSEGIKQIKLSDVHIGVSKMPFDYLSDFINDIDDAVTADVLLQTVFYGEIIF